MANALRHRLKFGYFADPKTGKPEPAEPIICTYWERDGRHMSLVRDVHYVDPDSLLWKAPALSVINGLSTPRFFWRIAPPYVGLAREASVIHDVACQQKRYPSWQVHRMFYLAMRASGVGFVKAGLRWLAVRLFGPRFKGTQR